MALCSSSSFKLLSFSNKIMSRVSKPTEEEKFIREQGTEGIKAFVKRNLKYDRACPPEYKEKFSDKEAKILECLLLSGAINESELSRTSGIPARTLLNRFIPQLKKRNLIQVITAKKRPGRGGKREKRVYLKVNNFLALCTKVTLIRFAEGMLRSGKIELLKNIACLPILAAYFEKWEKDEHYATGRALFLSTLLLCKKLGIDYYGIWRRPEIYNAFTFRPNGTNKVWTEVYPVPLHLLISDFADAYHKYLLSEKKKGFSFKDFWLERKLEYYPNLTAEQRKALYPRLSKFVTLRSI